MTPELVSAAEAPAVSAALTDTRVSITTGFRGAEIVLYGAVFDPEAKPSDVVVVVQGPVQPVRIVRKVRVLGLWLNSRPVVFEGAPGFYMAASTRPLGAVTNFSELRRLRIGLAHLRIAAPAERRVETRYGVPDMVVNRLGADYWTYRQAVVRLKQRAGLYVADAQAVRFVDKGLFRAEIALPAEAPTGVYRADIHLFQDGRPVSTRSRELVVEKVGVERSLFEFAHQRPWTYGLVSVLIALASGWAASVAFRRS